MFREVMIGAGLVKESIQALGKYPGMLIPLLLCWLVYASVLVAFNYHVNWRDYSALAGLITLCSAVLLLSAVFSWSAFMLLELIRQIEMNEERSLPRAIGVAFANLIIAFPVVIGWAAIWLSITLIELIFRRRRGQSGGEYNAKNVAKTVAGFDEPSLSGAFFDALKKGVRMAVFIIYPAIAWEKLGVSRSVKRGLGIVRAHKSEFAAGHVMTELASALVFLPPAMLFIVSDGFDINFPDSVWFGVIIYCALAWSFSLFLEQMFVAELYLWHLIWEVEVDKARSQGKPKPKLHNVKRPSIMDSVADLYLASAPKTAEDTEASLPQKQ